MENRGKTVHPTPPKGVYAPAQDGDKRSPCPLVNCLANHGYINRNGQNIRANDLNAAMNVIGLSTALGAVFAQPIYNEHIDPKTAYLRKTQSFFARLWYFVRYPWSILAKFGVRRHGQVDQQGVRVLNLDQLAIPGVIEHDISLTRRDHSQISSNIAIQKDLLQDLLDCSADQQHVTMNDLANLRKRRIQKQLDDNPDVKYDHMAHQIACTEIALIMDVFGNGKSIPCSYAHAVFKEERLPVKEGWTKRRWWTLGFYELYKTVEQVKSLVGLKL